MSKHGLTQFYRRISSKLLDLVVTPHVLGEEQSQPTSSTTTETSDLPDETPQHPVCYVLQTYSRSNALLVDAETRRLDLHPALAPIEQHGLDESASVLFLQHPKQHTFEHAHQTIYPPRLQRLIESIEKDANLDILLVPVTVLWGRAPDKEDSLFKLLFTDTWATPGMFKQLMNIGIHGRQTYLEFHPARSLRDLLTESQSFSHLSPEIYISSVLNHQLDRQRELILGPDLSDRRNVMQSLVDSPELKRAIDREVEQEKITVNQARNRAIQYANEIFSDYSYAAIRFADVALTKLWTQLYDGVEVHNFSTVRELAEKYQIVYTPCHRSHIDYLLLSYVIFHRGLMVPYIAAGDNLNMPFVGQLLRGGGAFFIRRSFKGNQLYTATLKEYLHSILMRNTPLEYFIEGGRSRSGRLLPPKTGMLAMTVHSYLRSGKRSKPIVFIPTYIGYERLMEGSTYVGEMQGKPKEAESVFGIIKTLRKIERVFGKVHVSFSEPVFLDDILKQHHADQFTLEHNDDPLPTPVSQAVTASAYQILENINRAAVINPISLLSLVLLATPKHTLDENVCIQQLDIYRNLVSMAPYDVHTEITQLSGRDIIGYGLKLKLIKRVKHVLGDIIAIEDNHAILLTYFRNNILHLFIIPSLIAALVEHNGRLLRDDLMSVARNLYPFLKAELFLKWNEQELDPVLDQNIEALIQNQLVLEDGRDSLFSPTINSEQYKQLQVLAGPIKQSLERYYLTLALINQTTSGSVSIKQIEDLSYLVGQRLSLLYEFNSPEFFDKAVFQSFLNVLKERGIVTVDENGQVAYDERLSSAAQDAHLILDESTLDTLHHITAFSDDELKAAMDELAKQKSRRLLKLKKK